MTNFGDWNLEFNRKRSFVLSGIDEDGESDYKKVRAIFECMGLPNVQIVEVSRFGDGRRIHILVQDEEDAERIKPAMALANQGDTSRTQIYGSMHANMREWERRGPAAPIVVNPVVMERLED